MKTFLLRAAHRAFAPLMFTLAATPAALLFMCEKAPQHLPAVWLFAALTLILGVICALLPGKWRLPSGLAGLAALWFAGYGLLPLVQQPILMLLPIGCCALHLVLLPIAARGGLQPFHYIYGVLLFTAEQVMIILDRRVGLNVYAPAAGPLTALFILYLSLYLLALNRITLENATMARHNVPVAMRRFNTALTAAFLALVLILSAVPAVTRAAVAGWNLLLAGFRHLSRLLNSLLPESGPMGMGGGGPADFGMMPMEYAEPSVLAVILEYVLAAVVGVLLFAGCLLLLAKAAKQLRRLARFLLQQIGRYIAAAAEEGDEVTDTREDSGERQTNLLRRLRLRPEAPPRTPEGRIRFTYARLLRRHGDWSESSTARENLPEASAALYEQARYSGHPVTQEEADRFAAQTRKL